MTKAIDLTPTELAIVRDILRVYVPPGTRVWVFGSRATAAARRYSDLDLALEADRPLSFGIMGDLAEAFSASDLPYKVDIIDLRLVDPEFRAMIEPESIALTF